MMSAKNLGGASPQGWGGPAMGRMTPPGPPPGGPPGPPPGGPPQQGIPNFNFGGAAGMFGSYGPQIQQALMRIRQNQMQGGPPGPSPSGPPQPPKMQVRLPQRTF